MNKWERPREKWGDKGRKVLQRPVSGSWSPGRDAYLGVKGRERG